MRRQCFIVSFTLVLALAGCTANNNRSSKLAASTATNQQLLDAQATIAALQSQIAATQNSASAQSSASPANPSASPTQVVSQVATPPPAQAPPTAPPTQRPTPPPVSTDPVDAGCPVDFPVKVAGGEAFDVNNPGYAQAVPVRCFVSLDAAKASGFSANLPPIFLQGVGQKATNPVTPPGPISLLALTHNGRSNFIVKVYIGSTPTTLVNAIGTYRGQNFIAGTQPAVFDIQADGAWTITITRLGTSSSAEIRGHGDTVSGYFDPPATGPWRLVHNGRSNFIVHLNCAGGSSTIQNEIGAVNGSRVVPFGRGPCFWQIIADGDWSLTRGT